jgi:predicted RNA-binding protein associated with RNAse of E/G family
MQTRNISPPHNIADERSAFAQNPVWVRFWLILTCFIKFIEIRRKIKMIWEPGDEIAWRGIFKKRIWHAQSTIVVKDTAEEIALAMLPGAECIAAEGYINGKRTAKRRWDYVDSDWVLEKFTWHTNRLLTLTEAEKYYSTILFWDDQSNEFLCYYINFQLPFTRTQCGIDTLDLDLDLIINPDLSFEWKDIDDYEKGIETGLIVAEWVAQIDSAKREIFNRLEKREYPFDGSWLAWKPDTSWMPPKFPETWLNV